MQHKFSQFTLTVILSLSLFSVSNSYVEAAPGSLGQIPLFVAPPTQPNIFFMLDDSGSMSWTMPSDGVSSQAITYLNFYHTRPDLDDAGFGLNSTLEWNAWCRGANLLAYNPAFEYKPWAANMPGTSTSFPDQTDISNVWVDPTTAGSGVLVFYNSGDDSYIVGTDTGTVNLSGAPVAIWTDDGNGAYDAGECPNSYADTARVSRADALSATEQTNFANWFAYYRIREHTTKAAVTEVISTSSARMGMATLHHNNGVGLEIKDMSTSANKDALLEQIVNINSSGGTPLKIALNRVGEYYLDGTTAPAELNIGAVASPILSVADGGECQQNFTMLMTDGQWNGGDALSVAEKDQDNALETGLVFSAHLDSESQTLADVAMKWYKTDLSSLTDKVPVQAGAASQNLDENKQQHMVTFGVAFGPNGTVSSDPADRNVAFTWPAPSLGSIETVDDLRHAAYNSRGKFLSANDPETLIASMQDVISDIESRQGSAAAVSFSSTSLVAGTSLFFASFDTVGWSGDLRAFSVDPNTGALSVSAIWSAASILDSKSNAAMLSRPVYTWGSVSAIENNGVLFNWSVTDPQPAANIISDFTTNNDSTVDVSPFTDSQVRLNFVKGDISNDGVGLIRERTSRLGDIINSAPQFVGGPISNWPDTSLFGVAGNRYSNYQTSTLGTTRDGIVYVGANDGLLHGFKGSTGEEVFTYLPSVPASLLDNTGLHYLTESDYSHRYYVDGLPISADVYMPITSGGTSDWRTILVGALGGGGQGLYALDVSDPSQFLNTQTAAENAVLWEFTSDDDDHLGFSFSVPQITLMNNGEWAVIIGNGYNATGTDTAELIILFIEKGLDGTWSAGDYIKLDTKKGTVTNKNGLSTPTLIDLDDDGTTDRIYAGDLLGNMWAFDVSDTSETNWEIPYEISATEPAPLFSATHHAGSPAVQISTTPQPITMKPLVVKPKDFGVDDDLTNLPNVMVYFGTGQYIATGDATNTDQQTFYGVWDAGIPVPSSKLIEQTFVSGVPIDARVLTQNSVTYPSPPTLPVNSSELGWFINLPESGERVVVDAFILEGLVFFNTVTPSSQPCSAGGESWLMAVDAATGGNPNIGAFDVNGDGVFDSLDKVSDGTNDYYAAAVSFGHGIASATAVITNLDGKSFGYISGTDSNDPHLYDLPSGVVPTWIRRSWKQLFN